MVWLQLQLQRRQDYKTGRFDFLWHIVVVLALIQSHSNMQIKNSFRRKADDVTLDPAADATPLKSDDDSDDRKNS